jgi:hypothetical protein
MEEERCLQLMIGNGLVGFPIGNFPPSQWPQLERALRVTLEDMFEAEWIEEKVNTIQAEWEKRGATYSDRRATQENWIP